MQGHTHNLWFQYADIVLAQAAPQSITCCCSYTPCNVCHAVASSCKLTTMSQSLQHAEGVAQAAKVAAHNQGKCVQ